MISKRYDASGNSWRMFDNKRDGANGAMGNIHANLNNAEDTPADTYVDFYSNGFRPKTTSTDQNAAGASYVYMAFAENSIVDSTGKVPVTAR